jgi:hypothetical protein
MLLDPRAILFFLCNVLLLYLTQLVNSTLSGLSLYLILLGPMLALPVLYLRHRSYFLCTLATGLWVDAAVPAPFGLFTTGFLGVGAFLYQMRIRFRAEHNYHPIVLAHGVNLICILLVSLATGGIALLDGHFLLGVLATTLASHLALVFVAPWFFNFERMFLDLLHLDTAPDDFPTL